MYQKMTAVTASGRTRHLTELYIFYFGLNKISKLVPYTARKVACFSLPFLYEMQCQVTQNVTQTGFGLSLRTRIGLGTFHRPCIGASPWFLDSIGLLPHGTCHRAKQPTGPESRSSRGVGKNDLLLAPLLPEKRQWATRIPNDILLFLILVSKWQGSF